MAENGRCRSCGREIRPDALVCPHCGIKYPLAEVTPQYVPPQEGSDDYSAPPQDGQEGYAAPGSIVQDVPPAVQDTPLPPVTHPTTIEELQRYCAEHHMPLEKMRFFIGVDYKSPRAFGIYREGDRFVVYKNKANGNRAVRYHGPDEAYAVNELFTKLLDECHKRGIYPDGKPAGAAGRSFNSKRRSSFKPLLIFGVIIALVLGYWIYSHRNDGYYRYGSNMYYLDGSDWYYYSGSSWIDYGYEPAFYGEDSYDDYYVGSDYDSSWGYSDVKDSYVWEESHSSDSDSDYDSWDSSDTDWDSDW